MSPISEMVAALEVEIASIKEKGGSSSIDLRGGRLANTNGSSYLYSFYVSGDVVLTEDAPVRVVAGGREAEGSIVSYAEGILTIALDRNLGQEILTARLIVDDTFLLQSVRDRLREVERGQRSFSTNQAGQVVGGQIRTGDSTVNEAQLAGLNPEQQTAVRRALGSSTTFIWGPPGTGKTRAVGRIVAAHCRRGDSVLLLSNTNVAVDTALEQVCGQLKDDSGFDRGLVLRYGRIKKPELERNFGDYVDIDRVIGRLGQDLRSRRERLALERQEHSAELNKIRTGLQWISAADTARSQVNIAAAEVARLKERIGAQRALARSATSEAERLKFEIDRADSMGRFERWRKALNPEAMRQRQLTALSDASRASRTVTELETSLGPAQERINQIEVAVAEAAANIPKNIEPAALRRRNSELVSIIGATEKEISAIDAELSKLHEQATANARVVATTVYRTFLKGQLERQFDVVVLDEASTLLLPMAYFAAGLAKKSVVVAGDFRQLAPITRTNDEGALAWLRDDVFIKSRVHISVDQSRLPDHVVRLRVQYRMQEAICGLVNDRFYGGQLITDDDAKRPSGRRNPLGFEQLIYVDSAGLHPWSALRSGGYSRYNLTHAVLVRNLVHLLRGRGYVTSDHADVGVISPYAAQVRAISALLESWEIGLGPRVVATVHRFQGNEKDVMIFEIPESPGVRPGRFVTAEQESEDGGRLINVALSRAKHQVVLVANFSYLRERLAAPAILNETLSTFEHAGRPLDAEEILRSGPEPWFNALSVLKPTQLRFDPRSSGHFTQANFYPAFDADLQAARRSIVIVSPFITRDGVSRWMDALKAQRQRGVEVRLVTRPPNDQPGYLSSEASSLIDSIRRTAITVDLRQGMHEKVAVIDGGVVWHGSLNILSHRDTAESMLRLCDEQLPQVFARLFETAMREGSNSPRSLSAPENPLCPQCEAPMTWKTGRYGIWFECPKCATKLPPWRAEPPPPDDEDGSGGREAKPQSSPERPRGDGDAKQTGRQGPYDRSSRDSSGTRRTDKAVSQCPKCGRNLIVRRGPRGSFLGCSGYPRCRYTQEL
jgi:ssDNA-binding Zn-finger/Zn-ribbon topoisomerase 1